MEHFRFRDCCREPEVRNKVVLKPAVDQVHGETLSTGNEGGYDVEVGGRVTKTSVSRILHALSGGMVLYAQVLAGRALIRKL